MAVINEGGGRFDEHKVMVILVGAFLTVTIGWLGWLSLQAISQDRSILVNSTNISSLSENQKRTLELIEKIQEKQHELEVREAKNSNYR